MEALGKSHGRTGIHLQHAWNKHHDSIWLFWLYRLTITRLDLMSNFFKTQTLVQQQNQIISYNFSTLDTRFSCIPEVVQGCSLKTVEMIEIVCKNLPKASLQYFALREIAVLRRSTLIARAAWNQWGNDWTEEQKKKHCSLVSTPETNSSI